MLEYRRRENGFAMGCGRKLEHSVAFITHLSLAYLNLWLWPPPLVITTNDIQLHECTRMFDCQSDGIWTTKAKQNTTRIGQTKMTQQLASNFNGGFMHNFFHCKTISCCQRFFSLSLTLRSLAPSCNNNSVAFVLISPFIYFSLYVHVIQMIRNRVLLPAPLVLSRFVCFCCCCCWFSFYFFASISSILYFVVPLLKFTAIRSLTNTHFLLGKHTVRI